MWLKNSARAMARASMSARWMSRLCDHPHREHVQPTLRSGLGVESYDSAYWRECGRPHFFRYVKEASATFQVASSSRTTNLKLTVTASPESHRLIPRNAGFNAGEEAETEAALSPARVETSPANVAVPRIQLLNSGRPSLRK